MVQINRIVGCLYIGTLLYGLGCFAACGGEISSGVPLRIAPDAEWKVMEVGSGRTVDYSGKGKTALVISATVDKNKHYRFDWTMKSSVDDASGNKDFAVSVVLGDKNYYYGYVLTKSANRYSVCLYTDEQTTVTIRLAIKPDSSKKRIEITNPTLVLITEKMFRDNLIPDGGFENTSEIPILWLKKYKTKINPSRIAENQSLSPGKKAMSIDFIGDEAVGMDLIRLPIRLGKTYNLTFQAKTDGQPLIMRMNFSVWSAAGHTGTHFYKASECKLTGEWQKYSFSVTIPSTVGDYSDLKDQLIQIGFAGKKDEKGKAFIDNLVFSEVKPVALPPAQ